MRSLISVQTMYELSILLQGYPGVARFHGGLGWSTVPLLRGHGETVLVDTGPYGYREPLLDAFTAHGIAPADVTAVVITHCHWDHISNFALFPNARVYVPRPEMDWAVGQPPGTWRLAEFHVEKLATADNVIRIEDGDEPLPGMTALHTPGHTPGHFAYRADSSAGPLVFSGDALKNERELLTGEQTEAPDRESSRRSIEKLRAMLEADSSAQLVCGHDRILSLDNGQVISRTELRGALTAWVGPDPAGVTVELPS
jgi:N-acyl homoserine lactone hydrolase